MSMSAIDNGDVMRPRPPRRRRRVSDRNRPHAPAESSPRECGGSSRCRRRRALTCRRVRRAAGRWRARPPVGCWQRHHEMKRAAAARLALDPDAAAHQLDELRGDRQAQARAAELARGRAVGLRERPRRSSPASRRDADAGVATLKCSDARPSSPAPPLDAHDDFARAR